MIEGIGRRTDCLAGGSSFELETISVPCLPGLEADETLKNANSGQEIRILNSSVST